MRSLFLRFGFVSFLAATIIPAAQAARIAVWVPSWDAAATTTMQTRAGSVSESNPVWYVVNADGSIGKMWNAENATLRAAMTGTQVLPTIQNVVNGAFSGSLVQTIIADPARRDAHAEAIRQLVVSKAYDGIDIDYEAVAAASRADFTAFIQTLAAKLHQSGKKLSVTVHAKTSDSQNWKGPGSQDWPALGAVADSIKIMAYDYSWDGSAAGPISPLDWIGKVTGYAMSVIPAQKVVVGLPWYGYDWAGTDAESLSHAEAVALASATRATVTHDVNGEATFTYSGRTVYYQDATSYRKKVEYLMQRYPTVGGFAHWAAGVEDPAIWTAVSSVKAGVIPSEQSPVVPVPAADFTISGPTSLSVQAGTSRTASFSATPINGFTGTTNVTATMLDSFAGSVTLSAATVAPNVATNLTVTPASSAAAGTYRLRIGMTSGTISHEQIVSVVVSAAAPADFAISAPTQISVTAGSTAAFGVYLSGVNGFSDKATLNVQMLDAFAGSVSASSSSLSQSSPVTVSVSPAQNAAAQRYRLSITATSGSIVRTTVVDVDVKAASKKRPAKR